MAATPELDLCPFTVPIALDNDGTSIDAGNATITDTHPAGFSESATRGAAAASIAVAPIVKAVSVVTTVTTEAIIVAMPAANMAAMTVAA